MTKSDEVVEDEPTQSQAPDEDPVEVVQVAPPSVPSGTATNSPKRGKMIRGDPTESQGTGATGTDYSGEMPGFLEETDQQQVEKARNDRREQRRKRKRRSGGKRKRKRLLKN